MARPANNCDVRFSVIQFSEGHIPDCRGVLDFQSWGLGSDEARRCDRGFSFS